MSHDDVLKHLTALCETVDLPINADFESGFASDPEAVAANVLLAVQTGVAGLSSIEDLKAGEPFALYDTVLAIEHIRAARLHCRKHRRKCVAFLSCCLEVNELFGHRKIFFANFCIMTFLATFTGPGERCLNLGFA